MGIGFLERDDDALERLVEGTCLRCDSPLESARFAEGNRLYTRLSCTGCDFVRVFQAKPSHHLDGKKF